jgi:predicted ester cyclase
MLVRVGPVGESGSGRRRGMPTEDNKRLGRRLIEELWGKGNLGFADEVVAPDFVADIAGLPEPVHGPEGVRQLVTMFRSAMPDLRETIEDQVAEDDKVTNLIRFSGTHQGEMLGIAPTGKHITVEVLVIQYFSEGKIVRVRGVLDALGMFRQIGAIPSPGRHD